MKSLVLLPAMLCLLAITAFTQETQWCGTTGAEGSRSYLEQHREQMEVVANGQLFSRRVVSH
ncbi:MAG: hypothetical protein H6559_29990 [Lewinellaceae bacterium]|nr:hypothetical protein [Lewinellaceae bacterium]